MMPVSFVIFGITGDLARNKLIPAIFHLYREGLLPKKFKVIGYSRRDISTLAFQKTVADIIGQNHSTFLKKFIYVQGQFKKMADYQKLGATLSKIDEEELDKCSHKLFYLAVPPEHYTPIAEHLSASGLTIPCGGKRGWTRILVEKPFGRDITTARKLNLKLGKLFKEEQIFRIDHYLAKETSNQILDFRFKKEKPRHSGTSWEKFWNSKYINKIELKLFEKKGVGNRGDFYDSIGALRDVGQNHLLEMLALIAMDRPKKFQPRKIQQARATLLEKISPIMIKELKKFVERGQYRGYLNEEGVKKNSKTETYFRLNLGLATPRWRGARFILESGKMMPAEAAGISVYFKDGQKVFFDYKSRSNGKFREAYEKVLYDCVRGDQTVFNSTREVEAAWKFITPILKNWGRLPLTIY